MCEVEEMLTCPRNLARDFLRIFGMLQRPLSLLPTFPLLTG